MLSISNEYRQLARSGSSIQVKATITFADGEVMDLTGADFIANTITFSSGTSSTSSFDIGSAVIGSFSATLNNFDRHFDEYDFTDAVIKVWLGETVSSGTEWLLKGEYTIEQPDSYSGTIAITALDNMQLLEKDFADVTGITYPITMGNLVRAVCDYCDLSVTSTGFTYALLQVQSAPTDNLTCLDIIGYVAQATCNYAYINPEGALTFDWYDASDFSDGETDYDGGKFDSSSPYSTGDTLDGGNFTKYSTGNKADGGDFTLKKWHSIHANSSLTVITDDVVITGVDVTASDASNSDGSVGEDGETVRYGTDGYVLTVENNPLIAQGYAKVFAAAIGKRVVGLTFRPFSASTIGDPSMESGDACIVRDNRGNEYKSFITNLTYKVGAYTSVSCGAETPSRNSAASFTAASSAAVQAARKMVKAEQTARESAYSDMMELMNDSSGLYITQETQEDGSVIYYAHDKSTLTQSTVVWKFTANVFAVSTDGGKTYPYALDVNGDAILNRIYAIGIDADYITTGTIGGRDNNGSSWNIDTGYFENTIKQFETDVIQSGFSKTLGSTSSPRSSDAVFPNSQGYMTAYKEDAERSVTKNNYSVTYNPIFSSNGGTLSIYAAADCTINTFSVILMSDGVIQDAAPSEKYIDEDSLVFSGGITSRATSTFDGSGAYPYTLFTMNVATAVSEGDLICQLTWTWKTVPSFTKSFTLEPSVAFNVKYGVARYHTEVELFEQSAWSYTYKYKVDETKKMYVKIAMTPEMLFGVYESYSYIYTYYLRSTGEKKSAYATKEVVDKYVGGFTVVDGQIRFIAADDWELQNGQRIQSYADQISIYPKDNAFYGASGDVWYGRGIFLNHGEDYPIFRACAAVPDHDDIDKPATSYGEIQVEPDAFRLAATDRGALVESWITEGVGCISVGIGNVKIQMQDNYNHFFFNVNGKKVAELCDDGTLLTLNGTITTFSDTE